jgi:acetolactate synthase small subunit
MKRELLITAKNKISTHSRIYNMFNKKGYDLESVVSNICEGSPEYIKMTLAVVKSDLALLEEIRLNLSKIVDIIEVEIV